MPKYDPPYSACSDIDVMRKVNLMKNNQMLNKGDLKTLMDETYPARRQVILGGKVTTKKLKTEYPLLFEANEVRSG